MKLKTRLNKKIIFVETAKYILYLGLFYVLSLGNINGIIFPFSYGLLVALMMRKQNIFICSLEFILASFLRDFSLISLAISSIFAMVFVIAYFIHLKAKKPIKLWHLCIYFLAGISGAVAFKILSGVFLPYIIIEGMLALLFMLALVIFSQAISVRGFYARLTSAEVICGGVLLLAVANGLSAINIYFFSFIKFFATYFLLILSRLSSLQILLGAAIILGIGAMLICGDTSILCGLSLIALTSSIFKTKQKYLTFIAVIAVEGVLSHCFHIYPSSNALEIIPVALGGLCYLLTSNKFIGKLDGFLSTGQSRACYRNIVSRSQNKLSKRLGELGDVFSEMNKVFRATIKGSLDREHAKLYLADEMQSKMCKNCPSYIHCHRSNKEETERAFQILIASALDRDKVSALDIPVFITKTCDKAQMLVGLASELSTQYKKYVGAMNSIDTSKMLIAEQLQGISLIMQNLSTDVGRQIKFDAGLENKIRNELSYNNIICEDVVIMNTQSSFLEATCVVREDCMALKKIEKIFSKVCSQPMLISEEVNSSRNGWRVLTLTLAPKYDVMLGISTTAKTGSNQNGDSYSLTRLGGNKFLLALCDGMGSGMKAEKASSLAMGLVENFYKAGFDSDIILSSVNKILSLGQEEMFSALDLCIIDLNLGVCDMIKLGAPQGYVKKQNHTEIVEAGALPIGILGSVTPTMKQLALGAEDMIVFCTDGIADSFFEKDDLKNLVSSSSITNPQLLADLIMKTALENCKGVAEDDMSVICARVFKSA